MTEALLALMQISDSAFPSGAFVHSYGLEQLVREQHVTDASELECFVTCVMEESLATADAYAAYQAACAESIDEVIEVDRLLFAMKAATELREACVATGRRFLEETTVFPPPSPHTPVSGSFSPWERAGERARVPTSERLISYREAVHLKTTPGCYPIAFAAVCTDLGVDAADVPGAFLLGAVTAILQSALRLMRVSHRDVQAALHRLRPQIAEIAEGVVNSSAAIRLASSPPLAAFHPLQDIASMRHERAEARLFAS
jgi:urease accessory protein